jgi:hypothetical protein
LTRTAKFGSSDDEIIQELAGPRLELTYTGEVSVELPGDVLEKEDGGVHVTQLLILQSPHTPTLIHLLIHGPQRDFEDFLINKEAALATCRNFSKGLADFLG